MQTTDNKILTKIKKAKRGSLFFIDDFIAFGNSKTVAKALERLQKNGEITRVARGIYAILEKDSIIGELQPSTEKIAEAIRKRDKSRIIPTGNLALNSIGLSTQVPTNLVYLTDGSARTIDLGKRKIRFKKTSPKNLSAIGKISGLVIQALREIGRENVTENEIRIVLEQLKNEDPYRLEHDIRLAPEWIRIIMRKANSSRICD